MGLPVACDGFGQFVETKLLARCRDIFLGNHVGLKQLRVRDDIAIAVHDEGLPARRIEDRVRQVFLHVQRHAKGTNLTTNLT